ncbi:MAG: hypothetical protein DRP93_05885 [Candidatus Neomarinimicrobiota bacterium]|nr:MAG: hypothetical protein DRP93_05885 [Candidatus Neomarinimicrobiota bacterium]
MKSSLQLMYATTDLALKEATKLILSESAGDREKLTSILGLHLEANDMARCGEVDEMCNTLADNSLSSGYRLAYIGEVYT